MSAADLVKRPAFLEDEDLYPSSDGKPMAETGIHVVVLLKLFGLLRFHFRERLDRHYFAANMYLYFREGKPNYRRAPDLMAIKGVDGRFERRSFKTWVENAVPCFIL